MRVVIGEDAALFRAGLSRLLQDAGCVVLAEAGDAAGVLAAIGSDQPDVVVLDIRMPPTHTTEGIDAALEIRRRFPAVGVLVLSQYLESHWAVELLAGGTSHVGYLLKDRVDDVDELVDALRRVARGGSVVDPQVVAALVDRRRIDDPLSRLSERERAVLTLMAEGRSNHAIAARLFLSEKTVETHVRGVFTKLDLVADPADHRRILAVLRLLRR